MPTKPDAARQLVFCSWLIFCLQLWALAAPLFRQGHLWFVVFLALGAARIAKVAPGYTIDQAILGLTAAAAYTAYVSRITQGQLISVVFIALTVLFTILFIFLGIGRVALAIQHLKRNKLHRVS